MAKVVTLLGVDNTQTPPATGEVIIPVRRRQAIRRDDIVRRVLERFGLLDKADYLSVVISDYDGNETPIIRDGFGVFIEWKPTTTSPSSGMKGYYKRNR